MDRLVFVVVALALLVATQAQADDPWFNAHCEESREIMLSARQEVTLSGPAARLPTVDGAVRQGGDNVMTKGGDAAPAAKPRIRSRKLRQRA